MADGADIPLLHQPLDGGLVPAGIVGHAVLIGVVQVGLLVPVGPKGHEGALGDGAVLGLPGLDVIHRHHEVGILGALLGLIDDHQRIHQLLHRDLVHGTAFAPEVAGYIHMGAVLAGHADLEAAHGSHHVIGGALHIVEQLGGLQGLEAVPVRCLRAQLMGQVHPLVLGGLQFLHSFPQGQVCHRCILLFNISQRCFLFPSFSLQAAALRHAYGVYYTNIRSAFQVCITLNRQNNGDFFCGGYFFKIFLDTSLRQCYIICINLLCLYVFREEAIFMLKTLVRLLRSNFRCGRMPYSRAKNMAGRFGVSAAHSV